MLWFGVKLVGMKSKVRLGEWSCCYVAGSGLPGIWSSFGAAYIKERPLVQLQHMSSMYEVIAAFWAYTAPYIEPPLPLLLSSA